MTRVDLVAKYVRLKPTLQDKLAEAFRTEYGRLRNLDLSPDEIFSRLQHFAGGNIIPTPATQAAVLAVLAFFFEECEIFERV